MWPNSTIKNAIQHPTVNFVDIIPETVATKKIAVSTLHITFVACLLI